MKTSEKRKQFTSEEETLLLNQLGCNDELRVMVRFLMKCSSAEQMCLRMLLVDLGMSSALRAAEVCNREFENLNV